MDAFLDPADFAVSASIETRAGETRVVNGIFDDPYMNAELGEYDMDTSRPRFLAKEFDLAGIRRGDAATIAGKSYSILAGPKSTGDGMASLELAEA
ncbi:MAG: hypothetical protein DI569_12975 [Sphingopyxis macrogoltabida]|uniref:Uncharacterized protein n=1 Tax=Sphingopyxis macrogoltabida TaxID=33050 RepID=A0A2W5KVW3_SPHMC|nr:MAG: hypothetical protein DI569_12975 [Sphingopyxis macrogoltabida]